MIRINGVPISAESIAREVQHHPAPSRDEAERQAATALIVRELMLQRAAALGLTGEEEEQLLARVIEIDVPVPEPTAEEIERYYRRNGLRFMTPALYEAAHIFFPARAEDEPAREEAWHRSSLVLDQILANPRRFAELAGMHSACSSKDRGGSLGQLGRGDTNAELEHALATMEPGTIAPQPIASRHGFHVLRLDHRASARQLPLEQVRGWIENHLRISSRRRAIAQYLRLLAGQASIEGFAMDSAPSPLVQ